MDEKKYQYVDRILKYLHKSLNMSSRGNAYQRLAYASILAIAPVNDITAEHVQSLIRSAQMRLIENDCYNARLLIENCVKSMERASYD